MNKKLFSILVWVSLAPFLIAESKATEKNLIVSWRLIHGDEILKTASATVENFQEEWTLIINQEGPSYIVSPRSKVEVVIQKEKYLQLLESDVLKLVGIKRPLLTSEQNVNKIKIPISEEANKIDWTTAIGFGTKLSLTILEKKV